jgi:hypothetical protein
MKKKAHPENEHNFFTLKSRDEFVATATVQIINDKVFIENEDACVMLSVEQAKNLSYFINDRLVRVVDFGDDIFYGEYNE